VRHVLGSIDWALLGAMAGLLAMGLVLIYSATYRHYGSAYALRQVTWIGLGLMAAAVVAAVPDYSLKRFAEVLFVAALGLALAVHLAGSVAYGARRWIAIFGVKMQPSEFLKVATILMLAKYTEHFKDRINTPVALGVLGAISGTSFVMILKQPDLGTATAILAIVGGVVFVAGID
jgi:cell division protein FtsW (lipid II flippase)